MGIQSFETNSLGNLPAGTDLSAVLADGDVRALVGVWDTYGSISLYQSSLARIDRGEFRGDDPEGARATLESSLAKVAAVTPAQALEANRRLVDLLTGYRWIVMQEAREAGDSWTTIGAALGMSKQGALDWYKRKIDFQEEYAADFHNTDRARAVLSEDDNLNAEPGEEDLTALIREIYESITTRTGSRTVRLVEIRDYMPLADRAAVDDALRQLAGRDGIHVRAEADQKTLTDEDRAAAITLGGTARHTLLIEQGY